MNRDPVSPAWDPGPREPKLSRGEVHVWRVSLSETPSVTARERALLPAHEVARADRFRFDVHRRRFTLGRAALRRVLARYLAERPERLEFRTSDHGKPFLPASVSDGLRFNSSDSEDLSLIAVTRDREVGIDIERIEPSRAGLDIAERFFSPDEFHRLEALPDALRVPAFFACWTRKEAYLKAIGTGLLVPLDSFSVAFEPGRPAELLSVDEDPAAAARWSLLDLGAGDGYAAALAIEDRTPVLRCWSWPPPDAGSP